MYHVLPPYLRSGTAVVSLVLVVGLKYAVSPWLPIWEGAYLFLTAAVVVTAVVSGYWPAVATVLAGVLIGCWWCFVDRAFATGDVVRTVFFAAEGLLICWAAERIRMLRNKQMASEVDRVADERGRLMLEAAPDAMVVVDEQRTIVLVNAQAERLFGYHRDELLGRSIEILIPARYRDAHERSAQTYIRHPTVRGMGAHNASALWGLRRDGSEFPVEVSLSPIVTGGDRLVASAIRDVTARRQLESRKEEHSVVRWSFLAESVPAIVWTADRTGRVTYMSPQWKQLTGIPFVVEDPEYSWRAGVHPDDADRALGIWAQCRETCEAFVTEYRVRRHDGEYIWHAVRGTQRRDADGGDVEWFGTLTEIQSLRTAQERAEATSRRLAALIDTAPIGIVTIDDDGIVRSWNRAAENILGWTAEEAIGKRGPHFPPEFVESGEWRRLVEANKSNKGLKGQETIRISSTGEPVPVVLWTVAISDGDQDINLHMLLDARETKKLEQQLRQAAKMEAIGRLAGGIAHDFNNMLQVINGYSTMLLEMSSVGGDDKQYLREIVRAGDRAAQLTSDLLKFSRQQVAQPKVVDLNSEIEDLGNMISRLLTEGIRLEFSLAPDAGAIRIDKSQLSQIVINLAVNARDAMPHGGRLIVETGSVAAGHGFRSSHMDLREGRYAFIAVTDTGHGMTQEVRERIFDPFFTTKKAGHQSQSGTGLGLSTVYGIVKQNGGDIYVYSEPERGSTFRVYLPQATAAELAANTGAAQHNPLTDGHEHILIVEDDSSIRRLVRTMFAGCAYRIEDTGNTDDALEYARAHPGAIDLLLTDLIMPDRNGKELAQEMRAMQPQMNVLFMSGFPGSAVVQQGMLDPDMEFIGKPFSAQDLRRRVRSVLDRGRAAAD